MIGTSAGRRGGERTIEVGPVGALWEAATIDGDHAAGVLPVRTVQKERTCPQRRGAVPRMDLRSRLTR